MVEVDPKWTENGFEIIEGLITPDIIESIKEELSNSSICIKGGGIRNAEKKLSSINALVSSDLLAQKAASYLTVAVSVVRAILFIKSPENNWLVSWHQDKTVAVSNVFDKPSWGPWSMKDNVQRKRSTNPV